MTILYISSFVVFSNLYTDLTIGELLQQLNPLYELEQIVAALAQVWNFMNISALLDFHGLY